MPLYYLLILALIQGLTEFLPISSSGHLILLPSLSHQTDQGQIVDVAAHLGTLTAVVFFFWKDLRPAVTALPGMCRGRFQTPGARLVLLLSWTTLPVICFGLLLKATGLNDHLRSIEVIGWTMLLFGLMLYVVDQKGGTEKVASDWSFRDALWMGLAQAIALIPGTSRSGITISAARWLGYDRENAARLSMLMSIPAILASGGYLAIEAAATANMAAMRDGAIVAVFSCAAALLALSLMMRLLRSVSFTPYVIYRILLGTLLLWIAYR